MSETTVAFTRNVPETITTHYYEVIFIRIPEQAFSAVCEETRRQILESIENVAPASPPVGGLGTCAICLENISPMLASAAFGRNLERIAVLVDTYLSPSHRTLRCGHTFHTDCVDEWFLQRTRNLSCPYCRESVEP